VSDTWAPETGRLVIRIVTWPDGREWTRDLLYHRDAADPMLTYSIAQRSEGTWEPCYSPAIECAKGVACKTGAGGAVIRQYATDEDLAELAATFLAARSLADWVEEVCEHKTLTYADKARLLALIGRTV